MKLWIVDAFTKCPYKGNPAAIAIVKEFPKDEVCQTIAAEMNLSETVFVKKLSKNHFHIRWFTPKIEVDLCGHGTLTATHILVQEKQINDNVQFESRSGLLKVSCSHESYTLDFPLQKTVGEDTIIEFSSEDEVRNYIPNISELKKMPFRGIIFTAKGSYPYDFVSRFFCPRDGINEDPVTGSAHCKLAYYWQQKLNKSEFLAYQASPRGGEIQIAIHGDRVHLTGSAVTILEGRWLAPLNRVYN